MTKLKCGAIALSVVVIAAGIFGGVLVVLQEGTKVEEDPTTTNHKNNNENGNGDSAPPSSSGQVSAVVPGILVANSSPSNPEGRAPTPDSYEDLDIVVAPTANYSTLQVVEHDATAFTQGLYYDQGRGLLVEATGLYGESLVRIWDPLSGAVQKETPTLDRRYFGEGLTWFRDADGSEKYIQITWKEQQAFIYDMDLSLSQTRTFDTTTGEGWGITFDPDERVFYVSDGSEYIHVWNLDLEEISGRRCAVTWKKATGREARAQRHLNELEWDPTDGTILANVWMDTIIVRIWPANGKVVQVYDMAQLESGGGDVLNGIAHHSENKWWITGKQWRKLYLLELLE